MACVSYRPLTPSVWKTPDGNVRYRWLPLATVAGVLAACLLGLGLAVYADSYYESQLEVQVGRDGFCVQVGKYTGDGFVHLPCGAERGQKYRVVYVGRDGRRL